MAIISAEVEASGFVLRLIVSGLAGDFGDYALSPDDAPRVVLASSHAGFIKSGGVVAAGALARSTVAMVPLRLPVDVGDPLIDVIDEVASGGNRQIRLVLADHIYASDTALSLAVLAGWRTGEAAASGISVTNSSTLVAPIPAMRWVVQPFQLDAAPVYRLSVIVASTHPVGFEPVAGVKFTLTDGTTVKTVWKTALESDNSAGDNLRCYTCTIDASAATALTAGMLRADAEVYPWLGAMRTTDAAGTRSMSGLAARYRDAAAESPLVLAYDPSGTRYSQQWVVLDPVNGTATPSSAMVATSLAGAKAVPAASKAIDIRTAVQAGWLQNRTRSAANGGTSGSRAVDGMRIVIPSGGVAVSGTGTTVSPGLTNAEVPVYIIGDPDDADSRANCIWRSGTAAAAGNRVVNIFAQNLTMEIGQVTLASSSTGSVFMKNVTVRGKAGFVTASTNITTVTVAAGTYNYSAQNVRWWRTGLIMNTGAMKFGFMRNVEHSRQGFGFVCVKNRWIGSAEDANGGGTGIAYGMFDVPTLTAGMEDIFFSYNDARATEGIFIQATFATNTAQTGTPNPSLRRLVILNNVAEQITSGFNGSPLFKLGENEDVTISYCIVEGNTFAGQRSNFFYNDPPVTTLADISTKTNQVYGCRVAGNGFAWNPNKQDRFNDDATQSIRLANGITPVNGYRPHLTAGWSDHMGAGREGNYDSLGNASASTSFNLYYAGLRSRQEPVSGVGSLGVVADRSNNGTGDGLGDYRPASGSLLLGRVRRGNSDRDFAGAARLADGAAGAFEAAATGAALLAPVGAVHSSFAGSAVIGVVVGLMPAPAAVTPGSASPTLALRIDLAPRDAGSVLLTEAADLFFGDLTIMVDSGRLTLMSGEAGLALPQGIVAARTLTIGAEVRVFFARLD